MSTVRQFKCFVCHKDFKTETDPILHYDEDEKGEDVSLCNACSDKLLNDIKASGRQEEFKSLFK